MPHYLIIYVNYHDVKNCHKAAFILLRRSRRVRTQTYEIAVCVPFHGAGFILYVA